MKKTILLASLVFIAFDAMIPSFAYNEIDLAKFKALNACEGCDLNEANLSGAYLHGANLYGADLSGINLSGTTLSIANLSGVDLSGAKLDDAKIR